MKLIKFKVQGRHTACGSACGEKREEADVRPLARFCVPLLAAFVWMLVLSGTARSAGIDYWLFAYSNNNMSAQEAINAQGLINDGGYWRPAPTSEWFLGNGVLRTLSLGDYTVYFRRVRDFYVPASEARTVSVDHYYTNYYHMYSNSLSVVVAGMTASNSAKWQFSVYPDEYTNSSVYATYGTVFTNLQVLNYTKTISNIPSGEYTITFVATNGYTSPTPNPVTTNISVQLANFVTGTYARIYGGINIGISPSSITNASWTITNYPSDYIGAVSGLMPTNLTNVPVGTYSIAFGAIGGYTTPSPTNFTFSSGTNSITATYVPGPSLTVTILTPVDEDPQSGYYLAGAGYGSYTVTEGATNGSLIGGIWHFSSGTLVTLSAFPTNATIGTNTYGSFFYEWYYVTGSAGPYTTTNITFTISEDRQYTLLFSREKYSYDNVGDVDGDGLPDEWENRWGLNPKDDGSHDVDNGAQGNPDNDFIPSTSTNPPAQISISTNSVITCLGAGGSTPDYPLQRARLLNHQDWEVPSGSDLGYAKGYEFNNLLECRGLDVYYLTNVPAGVFGYSSQYGDDPRTSPEKFDTFSSDSSTGISDGWRYYFWYWRAADAYSAGISNSANLSWVGWTRTPDRGVYLDEGGDTDKDGFTDGDEYDDYWTDPTHCDTDGDSMDDYWEITFTGASSNALDNVNGTVNPDSDFMAWVNQGILTTGMVGTALGTNVCWSGGTAANPSAAWNEVATNGNNIFELYKDTILKASSALTNRATGTRYAFTNYYGTNAGLSSYRDGYPVWVDADNSGTYTTNDYALVNPTIKHDGVYVMAPAAPYPGVCSFNPYTAWTNLVMTNDAASATIPYTTCHEYLGGDYIGRLSWDAGGQMTVQNDNANALTRNSYSNPQNQDTDTDLMPDGWELYTGLNDNNAADAGLDSDGDELNNLGEWANASHGLGSCAAAWPNKLLPTDPGIITAPEPNDPHPKDTDWDGMTDNEEKTSLSNPACWDTDSDHLPDGWELYAGTSLTNSDAQVDPDGDGLLNWQEYWCGTVPEWMFCDASWSNVNFCVRRAMPWDPFADPEWGRTNTLFIPPDFLTDACFMYANAIDTSLASLRTNYPARTVLKGDYLNYHTTIASGTNGWDSDWDNMDDFWEVYHGLNPMRGKRCLMADEQPREFITIDSVEQPDADLQHPGYQFGEDGNPFNSFVDYNNYIFAWRTNDTARPVLLRALVGPYNLGLDGMDPDGDGLPNLEEYSYREQRALYHTDPSPIWRTDQEATNSFIFNNYTFDAAPAKFFEDWGYDLHSYPFEFETVEGYDTDNDGVSDYAEINSAAGQTGNNPLDDRNPIRNRALYLNGTNDFARQVDIRRVRSESDLTRFCVEAWIKPNNPALAGNQVIVEKAGLYQNPLNLSQTNVGANFRLGLTNGLPFVLYNGRGSLRSYQSTAQTRHRITSNTNWTHIAGAYDGTNLTIYVNGEESLSLRTTELPANGFDIQYPNGGYSGTPQLLIVGAGDNNAGITHTPSPTNYFGGCIDEVRVWNGVHTRAEILANRNRRLTQSDITNTMSSIYNYFTFDDVPDPNRSGESVYPAGLADISSDMHPAITWWRDYAFRSTVYTGVTNSYNYIVYAEDHAWHSRARTPAYDDHYHFSTNYSTNAVAPAGYVNPGNPYHQNYLSLNDIYDLCLYTGARSVATNNSWLSGLSSDPDSTDSDGDGLPDWWEQLYNLDPYDAAGNNGAWGDVDNDGLDNRAEYLAGTNPRNSDTDGDGIGDYDSRATPYSRTWGEMYMDGDGMPDIWEIQYGLDPYHYDAHLDNDGDGWSNYAEYQGGTNPNDAQSYPQPSVSGSADYFGNKSGTFKFFVYSTNTMDGEPLVTQIGAGQQVAETIGTADGTLYFNGRLPIYPIDQATIVHVSAPAGTNGVTVTFTFSGPNTNSYSGSGTDWFATLNYTTGRLNIRWASTEVPVSGATVGVDYTYANRNAAAFSMTGFREGDFYLLALLDNGDNTFNDGEPMGIMEGQPLTLGHTSLGGVRIHVKDTAPGYGRFAWTGNTTGTSDYPVVINKISEQNAPVVLTRTMRWSRNYFHEWDYQLAGYYGLSAGTYQWWMGSQNGTFSVSWPASVSTPSLVYPRGDLLNYAVNQFKWTMDVNSTMYHLQVARQNSDRSLTYVLDNYYPTPYADAGGVSQADLPLYAGELGNGVYYWRVAGWNPAGESAWAEAQTFEINLNATNSHWIAGDIYYFGKADCSNIYVEVFDNKGFSGKPEARVLLTGAVRSNSFKGAFTLRGLEEGTYYVRAYLDVTPAGGTRDGKRNSPWESWGFIRDPNNDYQPYALALSGTMFIDGTKIVIRDQDTDNDLLPDAWEMYYFGNLDQTGDMDYDGDGETNLEEYMRDDVETSPALWDTDGDGLSDHFEINYTAPSFGYSARSGQQLDPTLWDTDGDRYSDGAEMKRYRTNPLDPTSYPLYQPMCFDSSRSPADYDGDGRSDLSVYDVATGDWYLMTACGQFFNLPFGSSATQPMLGDYDGDGCEDFAVFEPATGAWYLYNAWTGQSFRLNYGDSEMMPVPADYDGDNKTDLAVYYPAEGMWYVYSAWSGQYYSLNFGGPTMTPVPGDYNNDGAADLAVYEPNTGNWNFFIFDHYRHEGQYISGNFGGPTMIPAPGDYDGDGRNDAALFESTTGNWYILTWRGQFLSGQFGGYGCVPTPGDYDGDGRTDICVYYPPTGAWYIYCWSGQAYQVQFGFASAVPALKGR